MSVLASVTNDQVTYTLEPDRRWLGMPQYLVDNMARPECDAALRTLGLVHVEFDIMCLADVVMDRHQARVYDVFLALRHRYYMGLRQLLRWHLIERPHPSERFTWRDHVRPLGPIRHWHMQRTQFAHAQRVLDDHYCGRRYGAPIWSADNGHAT